MLRHKMDQSLLSLGERRPFMCSGAFSGFFVTSRSRFPKTGCALFLYKGRVLVNLQISFGSVSSSICNIVVGADPSAPARAHPGDPCPWCEADRS